MTDTTNPAAPERVELLAEAMWQDDFRRIQGRDRLVPWADANEDDANTKRSYARACLAALANPSGEDPLVREGLQNAAIAIIKAEYEKIDMRAPLWFLDGTPPECWRGSDGIMFRAIVTALAQSITSGEGGE